MTLLKNVLRVAVVESDPDDFALIKNYLEEEIDHPAIHGVKTVEDLKENLASGLQYDVMLLSLSPDHAEEPAREMVQLAGTVPVIVITAFFDKEFARRSVSLGISDYITKATLSGGQLFKSIVYSTERKRMAMRLNKSERNYRNLFNANPVPTWLYDVETYKFLNVNEAAIRHYGYSREEFLNMTIKDIRPAEDAHMIEDVVTLYKNSGEAAFGNYRHVKKNGEVIHVDIRSNDIEFAGKKGRMVLAMDVSERKKYTQAIENQNKLLRDIAWTQSHVVRAPLARMMGLIDILDKKGPCPQVHEELLPSILNSAAELDVIIRDIVKKTYVIEGDMLLGDGSEIGNWGIKDSD